MVVARALLVGAALVRWAPPPAPRATSPLLDLGRDRCTVIFTGSLLGVQARVALDTHTRVATVDLEGQLLGGRIGGVAALQRGWTDVLDDEVDGGEVWLEPAFRKRLRRRGVRVGRAELNHASHVLSVSLVLPVLGRRVMLLS